MKNYAEIAKPLTELLSEKKEFVWNSEAQKSFESLREALVSPPILAMPTENDMFTVDADASDESIGCVLSQCQNGVERVVAYASRKL